MIAAAAVAGNGGRGGLERKRGGGTAKYCECSDVTTPQSSARREAAAAVAGDGKQGGAEHWREAWWPHDYCEWSDMTTIKN